MMILMMVMLMVIIMEAMLVLMMNKTDDYNDVDVNNNRNYHNKANNIYERECDSVPIYSNYIIILFHSQVLKSFCKSQTLNTMILRWLRVKNTYSCFSHSEFCRELLLDVISSLFFSPCVLFGSSLSVIQ